MRHRWIGSSLLALLAGAYPLSARAAPPCAAANVRWSAVSDRLYLSGDVQCTLTDLRRLAPAEVPLTLEAGRIWTLGTNLIVEQGAQLIVDGAAGGDATELRLKSDGSAFVEIRAEWGTLTFRNTRVTSWDTREGGPDTEYASGRALIRALSYLDADGETARESRMDVISSDMGYLGYYAAESYGLVWKVRGETAEIFAAVDVFGDITDSTLHHNYFGMYSFGAYGMHIAGSELHDNVMYGIDPHDDSDSLLVEDNYIHDNGNHGFICSKRCDNLVVRNNVSSNNATIGFMFHRDVRDSILEGNTAENNGDAGFAIMDSHANTIRGNTARDNLYGIRLSVGASDNLIESNVVTGSTLYGFYLYMGTDPPTINDGRPVNNRFVSNEVTGNTTALKAGDALQNTFEANIFRDNGIQGAILAETEENVFRANDFGGSYLFAQGATSDIVADTDAAEVQLGGADASFTFEDATGRVFDTPLGLATTVDAAGSHLSLTQAMDPGIVPVTALPLRVVPADGDLDVRIDGWLQSSRAWTTLPGSAGSATYTVGGLLPGVRYVLSMDGARVATHTADATGAVTFTADVAPDPQRFALVSIRRLLRPSWSFGGSRSAVEGPAPRPGVVR